MQLPLFLLPPTPSRAAVLICIIPYPLSCSCPCFYYPLPPLVQLPLFLLPPTPSRAAVLICIIPCPLSCSCPDLYYPLPPLVQLPLFLLPPTPSHTTALACITLLSPAATSLYPSCTMWTTAAAPAVCLIHNTLHTVLQPMPCMTQCCSQCPTAVAAVICLNNAGEAEIGATLLGIPGAGSCTVWKLVCCACFTLLFLRQFEVRSLWHFAMAYPNTKRFQAAIHTS